jgi:hypothetical protein
VRANDLFESVRWFSRSRALLQFGEVALRKRIIVAALAVLFGISISPVDALARCESGEAPDYNDISDIDILQSGCGSTLTPGNPASFQCSRFWVSFSRGQRTLYSQYNLSEKMGTYVVGATLDAARNLLKRHDYYRLSPTDEVPTDISWTVVAVKRCSVVTSIKFYDWPASQGEKDKAFLHAFQTLLMASSKVMVSTKPRVYSGIANLEGFGP